MKGKYPRLIAAVITVIVVGATIGISLADGTESLGAPSVSVASGSGVVAAGTGMFTQPAIININVPGSTVNQALLYWGDRLFESSTPDDTIRVNGTEVTGTLIGGPTTPLPPSDVESFAFRADITGFVGTGANALTLDDLTVDGTEDGAGVLVIFDDGTSADIQLVDGSDYANAGLNPAPPLSNTVPQTFNFAPEDSDRLAEIVLFVTDVTPGRTNRVDVSIDGGLAIQLDNPLASNDGARFDTLIIPVNILAGATSVTIEVISGGPPGDPSSLNWIMAALSLPTSPEMPAFARITGGGWRVSGSGGEAIRSSGGMTLHCDINLSNNLQISWDRGQKWHINKLVDAAFCEDNPDFTPEPPVSPADTYIGIDVGKLGNVDGSVACFIFEDHGEVAGDPDGPDQALIRIWDIGFDPGISEADLGAPGFDCLASTSDPTTDPNTVLFVPLQDINGNMQFHFDQPHK